MPGEQCGDIGRSVTMDQECYVRGQRMLLHHPHHWEDGSLCQDSEYLQFEQGVLEVAATAFR